MEREKTVELLCNCLATEADAAMAGRLARLSSNEWDDLVQLAAEQRVIPLLADGVKRFEPDACIPSGIAQTLRERWLQGAARNAYLYRELGDALSALQGAGIPVILLKGAHLAKLVYDNMALRSMSDVDILVKRADALPAGELLLALGYAPSRTVWREAVDAAHHHLPAFTKENAAPIEIHWGIMSEISPERQIANPFCIDMAGLWDRAQPAEIAGSNVLVLSPEDALLHLCIHASSQHRFRIGIQAICDVAVVLRRYETTLDWLQMARRARQWRAENCAYLMLRLAQELLKAPVPDEALAGLCADDFQPHYVTWAKDQIFSSQDSGELPDIHNLARVRESSRLSSKISILCRIVFPPRQVVARIYAVSADSMLVHVCYVRRISDLVRKYSGVIWRLWRGKDNVAAVVDQDNRVNALLAWLAKGETAPRA